MFAPVRHARGRVCLAALVCLSCAPLFAANLETSPSSVNYLPMDEDVKDEIVTLSRLIAQQEWAKVIETCQRHIGRPPKTVVKLGKETYGSARTLCERKLAGLPEAAKSHYRTLYDAKAGELYRRAREHRDLAAARQLVEQFALTSHGRRGMNLLAGLLFARGEAHAALAVWMRWASGVTPDSDPEGVRRLAAAKMAVAAAVVGDDAALDRAITVFGRTGAVVEIGGTKVARSEELRKLARAQRRIRSAPLPLAPPVLDVVLWTTQFRDRYASRMADYYGSSRRLDYTCHGALADGVLYVNTADGPAAFETLTGREVWRLRSRNYQSDYYSSLRAFNFYCRVYPRAGAAGGRVAFVSGGVRCSAHEAKTGKVIWSKTRSSFARVAAIGNDRQLRLAFTSPVVCRGERAYVMLATSRAEALLVAFERSTGKLVWSAGVGGSAPRSSYRVAFPSALAVVGSDLVFCTGLGIVGKCDAATGAIRWLVPYRRRSIYVKDNYYNISSGLHYSPVAVAGDAVMCCPVDGGEVFAVRVSDGHVKWRQEIPGGSRFAGGLPSGDAAGRPGLVLCGKEVRCLRADDGSILWTWPVPEESGAGGRVTDRGVAVATQRGLYLLDARCGELLQFCPLEVPGKDLSVVSDADVAALLSKTSVCVVAGKQRTGERVAAALQAAPADPWVLAARARSLRSQGQHEAAIRRLAEAARTARKQQASLKLAGALEKELVELYHTLYETDWKAGRRVAGFEWILRALRSPGGTPYQCKFGYRAQVASKGKSQHKLIMASGDVLSGELVGIEGGVLTFLVHGHPWRIDAAGARWVVLVPAFRTDPHVPPPAGYVVFSKDKDVNTAKTLTLKEGVLHVPYRFGNVTLRIALAEVAAIACSGAPGRLPPDGVYLRLRTGDRLSGTIQAFDGSELILDIPFCGKRRVKIDDVYTLSNRREMPPPETSSEDDDVSRRRVLRKW